MIPRKKCRIQPFLIVTHSWYTPIVQSQQPPPKICYTAAGVLIHQDRVLLVKHKKLGFWLNPGGHIEENELPHETAEREFWEETGVRVRAAHLAPVPVSDNGEFLPSPFLSNIHWISEQNYQHRLKNPDQENTASNAYAKKGCEKHLSLLYLVEPVAGVEFQQNLEESDGIEWFTEDQISNLETRDNIKFEISQGFRQAKPGGRP